MVVRMLEKEGRILENGGEIYGETEGWIRLNIDCPCKLLLDEVDRICRTLRLCLHER